MATARIGNAAFTWDDSNHPGLNRQVSLGTRLFNIRPFDPRITHIADSLDMTVRNVISFGDQVYAVTADVRFHDIGQELDDLIAAGKSGTTLTYYPNLQEPAESFSVYLTDGSVSPDPDMAGKGWYAATLTLRSTDGTSLQRLMDLDRLLFKYVPGMDLSAATFTRATTATYTDIDGTVQTDQAAANEARDGHYQTVDSVWTRTLRLESAESENLYIPITFSAQSLTIYYKGVVVSNNDANDRLVQIGGADGASSHAFNLYWEATTDYLAAGVNDYSNNYKQSVAQVTAAPGSVVEVVGQWDWSAATVTCTATVDGGSAVSGTAGTSIDTTGDFYDKRLYIGSYAGSAPSDSDTMVVKVAAGIQTLDRMRAY